MLFENIKLSEVTKRESKTLSKYYQLLELLFMKSDLNIRGIKEHWLNFKRGWSA